MPYRNNKAIERWQAPGDQEPALCPKIVRLSENMLEFAEEPRDLVILDQNGEPLKAGDHDRRFFEASWMHQHNGKYYFSYSTGDTHLLCYATSDNPYGPFTYQGVILTPVVGWTTHHSICEFKGKWYLFHHDSRPSGGRTWLLSLKVVELEYLPDGSIKTIQGEPSLIRSRHPGKQACCRTLNCGFQPADFVSGRPAYCRHSFRTGSRCLNTGKISQRSRKIFLTVTASMLLNASLLRAMSFGSPHVLFL